MISPHPLNNMGGRSRGKPYGCWLDMAANTAGNAYPFRSRRSRDGRDA